MGLGSKRGGSLRNLFGRALLQPPVSARDGPTALGAKATKDASCPSDGTMEEHLPRRLRVAIHLAPRLDMAFPWATPIASSAPTASRSRDEAGDMN